LRPEKDTKHPPGQIVNKFDHPQFAKKITTPSNVSQAAIEGARPLAATAPREYLEGLLKSWREQGQGITYTQLAKLLELMK